MYKPEPVLENATQQILLNIELKRLWNMKLPVIQIVAIALKSAPKDVEKRWKERPVKADKQTLV